jgi:hypothetical protein
MEDVVPLDASMPDLQAELLVRLGLLLDLESSLVVVLAF